MTTQTIFKTIGLCTTLQFISLTIPTYGQTISKNYVKTYIPMVPTYDTTGMDTLTPSQLQTTVKYSDGWGRTTQAINVSASSQRNDIITFNVYDKNGRTPKDYLHFTQSENNGQYVNNPEQAQLQFHQSIPNTATNNYPFGEAQYNMHPGGRKLEIGAIGPFQQLGSGNTSWSTTTINLANQVRQWKTVQGPNGMPTAYSTSFYPAGVLMGGEITDPNGAKVKTFTDKTGKTILKQRFNPVTTTDDNGVTTSHLEIRSTYFAYDIQGRPTIIIPPKAYQSMEDRNDYHVHNLPEDLVYIYDYDERGRVISKHIPGTQGLTCIVYDKMDRPFAVQNPLQKQLGQWGIIKYDQLGRPIINAVVNSTANRAALQTLTDLHYQNGGEQYEIRAATTPHGYTRDRVFPSLNNNAKILAVYYYDDYDYNNDGNDDVTFKHDLDYPTTPDYQTIGKPTGTMEFILNTTEISCAVDSLLTTPFYDDQGKIIQSQTNNTLGGTDISFILYDYVGHPEQTKNIHTSPTDNFTLETKNSYDRNILIKQYQRITQDGVRNNDPWVEVKKIIYNDFGQVIKENIHLANNGKYLQSIDYQYNEQGKRTHINDCNLTPPKIKQQDTLSEEAELSVMKVFLNRLDGQINQNNKITYLSKQEACEASFSEGQLLAYEGGTDPEQYQELENAAKEGQPITIDLTGYHLSQIANNTTILQKIRYDIMQTLGRMGIRNKQNQQKMANIAQGSLLQTIAQKSSTTSDNPDLFGCQIFYDEKGPLQGSRANYNDDVSGVCSQNAIEQKRSAYDYYYNDLGEITKAQYGVYNPYANNYTNDYGYYNLENIAYDYNGNVTQLQRKGVDATTGAYGTIDDLDITLDGNQPISIEDAANLQGVRDFHNNASTTIERTYNANGFLESDLNKDIILIEYNPQLNLPTRIVTHTGEQRMLYTASGAKIETQTMHYSGSINLGGFQPDQTTHYAAAIYEYEAPDQINKWNYIPTGAGRLLYAQDTAGNPDPSGLNFRYEYTLSDHLGNARISFADINGDGTITIDSGEAFNPIDYYVFGMEHETYQPTSNNSGIPLARGEMESVFRFNGKEHLDKLNLNLLDYGARLYDPAIASWNGVDPKADKYAAWSPYNFVFNRPSVLVDPDGQDPTSPEEALKIFAQTNGLTPAQMSKISAYIDGQLTGRSAESVDRFWKSFTNGMAYVENHVNKANDLVTLKGSSAPSPLTMAMGLTWGMPKTSYDIIDNLILMGTNHFRKKGAAHLNGNDADQNEVSKAYFETWLLVVAAHFIKSGGAAAEVALEDEIVSEFVMDLGEGGGEVAEEAGVMDAAFEEEEIDVDLAEWMKEEQAKMDTEDAAIRENNIAEFSQEEEALNLQADRDAKRLTKLGQEYRSLNKRLAGLKKSNNPSLNLITQQLEQKVSVIRDEASGIMMRYRPNNAHFQRIHNRFMKWIAKN